MTMKQETDTESTMGRSFHETSGKPRRGNPPGTCPTILTPVLSRWKAKLTAIAATNASSAPGK
jgi:hypothetical protein